MAIFGTIAYFAWPKNKSVESKTTNSQSEIQQLKTELNSIKNELIQSDNTKKSQLESKLTEIENKVNEVVKQNNSPQKSDIKKLEQQLKEIKDKLEEDKPEPDNNDEKKEAKLRFVIECPNEKGEINYCFNNFLEPGKREIKYFYISENHPRIKQLLSKGKLKEKEKFIIRYKKIDKCNGPGYFFSKNNKELEIIET